VLLKGWLMLRCPSAHRYEDEEADRLSTAVAEDLGLTPEQTARAVVNVLMACPKTPHWFDSARRAAERVADAPPPR
jgi:hypothetical protein